MVFDADGKPSDLAPLRNRFEDVGGPADLTVIWFAGVLRNGFADSGRILAAPWAP